MKGYYVRVSLRVPSYANDKHYMYMGCSDADDCSHHMQQQSSIQADANFTHQSSSIYSKLDRP